MNSTSAGVVTNIDEFSNVVTPNELNIQTRYIQKS